MKSKNIAQTTLDDDDMSSNDSPHRVKKKGKVTYQDVLISLDGNIVGNSAKSKNNKANEDTFAIE